MPIRIAKSFDFDAAHMLPFVPADHKCRRLHGHTYRVTLICEGALDSRGMVLDYAQLSEAWAPLHEMLDHRYLNDIEGLDNPTTEHLALWILKHLGLPVVAVRVYESASTYCEVTR